MDTTKTSDVAELAKLGLSTFLNIGQMARYQYTLNRELQKDGITQVNTSESVQNRDKMIKYTCLAGLGIVGLLVIGVAGLNGRE